MTLRKRSCPRDTVLIDIDAAFCIKQAARYAYPEEACGVLLGDRETGMIRESWCMENRADEEITYRYYMIDPRELFRLENRASYEGFEIVGFWHSHADAEAILSGEDERCMIPGLVYLILPVSGGKPGRERAYEKSDPDGTAAEIGISLKERG